MSNYIDRLKPYNSYSGCDMVATLQVSSYSGLRNNIYTLGSLQTISISTHQDKRPVRSLGNINAKEYTMGQRTIAGSLVFAVFDKHFADQMFKDSLDSINQTETQKISTIMLPDELPPFDITISYANEYGHTSRMALYGVRLINEGQVMSINDIYTENTYQFVATALEPLNKDENIGQAQRSYKSNQIQSNSRSSLHLSEEIKTILDSYNNGGDLYQKDKINLSVDIENPNSINDLGLAKFILDPSQTTGEIKIYDASNNLYSIYLQDYPNSKTYSMYLKTGTYYAYYTSNDKTSNTATFKVSYNTTVNYINNTGPIIDYITDKDVCVLSNNVNHDMAACYIKENINELSKSSTLIDTVSLKSKKALFTSLTPNTLYEFKTYNSSDLTQESLLTQTKTLKYQTEMVDEFKDYLLLNKDVLTNDVDKMIDIINENTSSVKKLYNLIDFSLSLSKNSEKIYPSSIINEIIFSSIKFQNHINYELNKYALIKQPTKHLSNPFYNLINIPQSIEHCNIFKTDKGKSIFKEKVSKVQIYDYIDKSNIRYYAYGVNDFIQGPKYDFVCFSASAKDELSNYLNCNKLNSLSTDTISNMYPEISSINTKRLAAEYFKHSNITYLSKPMVLVNQDLSLDISLNYGQYLSNKDEIVICFSQVDEVLDNTTRKKVRFNYTDNLSITSFYSGIEFNNSYAVWIENTDGFIISNIETFNTHLEDQDIIIEDENIKTKQLEKQINSISSRLKYKLNINTELNEILESEKYNYDSHESLVYDNLISAIVRNKSALENDFNIINKLLEVKVDTDVFLTNSFNVKAKYFKQKDYIKFISDKYLKISHTHIDDNTGEISKSIKTLQDNIFLLNQKTGYTILFCIADGLYANSGVIVINNKTKDFYNYKISMEVI